MNSEGSIIITGASGGIGAAASEMLAEKGRSIIMACRNLTKAERVREDMLSRLPGASIEIAELHLDSFESVREFAKMMEGRRISALFNNAGAIPRRLRICEDGYEESLTVNYLSPWLLTMLLLPQLKDGGRVVNMISLSCNFAKLDRSMFEAGGETFSQLDSYARSKLALLFSGIELTKRHGVSVNLVDPGIVDSGMIRLGRWFDPLADIFFRPICKTPKQGALPAVNALLTGEDSRLFKGHSSVEIPSRFIKQEQMHDWLWEKTGKIVHFL